ncbi:MAG TPA: hypothetical protein PK665_13535, partial [Ignavibacteriaceae bacterium]|nr:hypothetical protein [Ignavibacteriaceae bacterium]
MKTFTKVTFIVILLFPIQIFSQTDSRYQFFSEKQPKERINYNTQPYEHLKEGLQIKDSSNSDIRSIINKNVLDNGSLLVEKVEQNWDGSNWINY